MSSTHVISHGLRASLLVTAGSALIAVPLLVGLDAAPIVTGVMVGILAIALGLAGTEPGGRGTSPSPPSSSTTAAWRSACCCPPASSPWPGQLEAMALFAVAGLAALVMTAVTRYSARAI